MKILYSPFLSKNILDVYLNFLDISSRSSNSINNTSKPDFLLSVKTEFVYIFLHFDSNSETFFCCHTENDF